MIRGQKNYLLPTHLQLGFSFLFRVDESSAFRHADERKTRTIDAFSYDATSDLTEPPQEDDDTGSLPADGEDLNGVVEKSSELVNEHDNLEIKPDEAIENNVDETEADSLNLESADNHTNDSPDISDDEDEDSLENFLEDIVPETVSFEIENKGQNYIQRTKRPQKKVGNEEKKENNTKEAQKAEEFSKQGKLKRGQKSRLKKIKEKYKDQDEEEQKLRMSLLQSAGTSKKNRKGDKNFDKKTNIKEKKSVNSEKSFPVQRVPNIEAKTENMKKLEDDDETEAERDIITELDMLSLLTGLPHSEDEIIFAIPVIAPYSAVLNYKFKVKLIPGLGKRGKSARTAVESFVQSKECSPREKDVMRSVNDQMLSQNFPGKVKVVSAQLKLPKKKK